VEEFLETLSGKQAQRVVWVLRLVDELDSVPAQYLKKLVGTEGLWEIRVQHGGEAFRILGFFGGQDVLVLAHGFAKKSDRVPRREIDRANVSRRDYMSRRT
jgi:phage-related protein